MRQEFGLKKSLFFCFSWLYRKVKYSLQYKREKKIEMGFISNFEETQNHDPCLKEPEPIFDVSSAMFHQPYLNKDKKKVIFKKIL